MVDAASGLPGLIFYRCMLDCVRVQHEREQDRINCHGCFLLVHTLVGEAELAVRFFFCILFLAVS
jgi:hypothetical protein